MVRLTHVSYWKRTGPLGHIYARQRCVWCGQEIADNWLVRHYKSYCRKGGEVKKLKERGKPGQEHQAGQADQQ